MARLLFVLFAALLISGSQSANILGVFTSLSPSHLILQMSMAKVLAEGGHNVTVVTAMKPPIMHKDIHLVQVPTSEQTMQELNSIIGSMAGRDNSNMLVSLFKSLGQMTFMFDLMRDTMAHRLVRNLYEQQSTKFDLVIIGSFMNNYQIGLAHKLKAPVVLISPMPANPMFDLMIGNPTSLSYVPITPTNLEPGQGLSLMQRIKNFVGNYAFKIFIYIIENNNKRYYSELYGDDPSMPDYAELTKNVSMIFCNSHGLSEGPIRAAVPALVEVSGLQIKDTPDALPQEMAEFISKAKHGAILLSLGSNVKGEHIKPDTVTKMFNVLSKLKQRVIWKWEDLSNVPGKSPNILYSKWLPQDDILAQPNLKLFITHAGKGGITEATYHGKPMLALPVFGDQPNNAEKMVKSGFGLSLSLLTLEEQPFQQSLDEVLNNPMYADKVKAFSALYRDRPLTARQSVLYWTEYVLRHHGAQHMQSPLVHMGIIAANNLDVYALLLALLIALLFLAKCFIKFVYKKCTGKAKQVKKAKKH
ncbi:CG5999 [Drosophila busckii]|uniref:CG5999 n=1 Tax=Drosophila busckii TaxID=30019 RepID=A0A0M4E8M0_DROBS|nr:UDP-glucuronosyltransferase 2B15 [Drosophila busckii]ALC38376.1 CG5999 [Drosophila busckii]